MRTFFLVFLLIFSFSTIQAQTLFDIDKIIHEPKSEARITLDRLMVEQADLILEMEPPVHTVKGRRLRYLSNYVQMLSYLGYVYQLTEDKKYAHKAEELLLVLADYPDWNESHFLDVSMMTLASAVGLDWTRKGLKKSTIKKVQQAIIAKGLRKSVDMECGFLTNTNNWNQVNNAGMAIGAMAVWDQVPDLADSIIQRANQYLTIPQMLFFPDGVYPEGPSYWDYGNAFHTMFLDAYSKKFKGKSLEIYTPYLKSKDYILHMTGPQGVFNYFDNKAMDYVSAPFLWMCRYSRDYAAMHYQKKMLWEIIDGERSIDPSGRHDRFFAFALLFLNDEMLEDSSEQLPLNWAGMGINPVSAHRSGWGDHDVFIAIKGGTPNQSHSHMDIGTFVLDAKGKRWVDDLGRHEYHPLEAAGLKIWDHGPDSDRWKVFRLRNHAHATYVIDDQPQDYYGMGRIIEVNQEPDNQSTMVDLTESYHQSVKQLIRKLSLPSREEVFVEDILVNNGEKSTVRWAFPTKSKVRIVDAKTATLTQANEQIKVEILSPVNVSFSEFSAQPILDFESPNPGFRMLGFEWEVKPNQKEIVKVRFDLQYPDTNEYLNTIKK
ncbi:heparinase II/III domain-containing protein [Persicobacter diffluens]